MRRRIQLLQWRMSGRIDLWTLKKNEDSYFTKRLHGGKRYGTKSRKIELIPNELSIVKERTTHPEVELSRTSMVRGTSWMNSS